MSVAPNISAEWAPLGTKDDGGALLCRLGKDVVAVAWPGPPDGGMFEPLAVKDRAREVARAARLCLARPHLQTDGRLWWWVAPVVYPQL